MDWIWWIFQGIPFQHLVRVIDCFLHEGIKVGKYEGSDLILNNHTVISGFIPNGDGHTHPIPKKLVVSLLRMAGGNPKERRR